MGGVNEKTIETKRPAARGSTTIGKIRIHESAGEVHFHDDAANLKVAVPSGKFWAAWSGNVGLRDLVFHDTGRGANVLIQFSRQPVEANIQLYESKTGDAFKQLNDFAMGR